MDSDEHRAMSKLRVDIDSSLDSNDDRDRDDLRQEVSWSSHHHPAVAAGNIKQRRLLSKQLSMKETTREAKWEKRRRQILRRSSMVAVNEAGGLGRSPVDERAQRCLTDEDLDELRGSFELGFGFDEEKGGTDLCDTLPALDLYFAVNRQLSDPKLRSASTSAAVSPTAALSSSSTLVSDTSIPRSPDGSSSPAPADAWTIFSPGDNPQLMKTRLRHWAQVVACSVKHGC
ncbi:uncharacterized protein LOC102700688 [Oryza brachyantha]|uniref:Uncharacterized protein n=1 Tax=Oryza brachyantha TaxID=4533 RepID=J3LCL3_ORYBR|nr:uncharacterized protein LOC102700688 [Oryza brachyantha]